MSKGGHEIKVKELKTVYSAELIAQRVKELAAEIDAHYGQEPLVAVCVLKGGFVFFSDLVRALHNKNLELDFVRLSSYGKGASTSKHVIFSKDVEIDICDKHVLIVEDIVDTGLTLKHLKEVLSTRSPASLKVCALLDKKDRRVVKDLVIDYCGFDIPNYFVVGYGLDFAEKYRNYPFIFVLKPEYYQKRPEA